MFVPSTEQGIITPTQVGTERVDDIEVPLLECH